MVVDFLSFILACFGITWFLVHSDLIESFRPEWKLFRCSACMGFHVGWAVFYYFWWHEAYLFNEFASGGLIFGFISMATSHTLCLLSVYLELVVDTIYKDNYLEECETVCEGFSITKLDD